MLEGRAAGYAALRSPLFPKQEGEINAQERMRPSLDLMAHMPALLLCRETGGGDLSFFPCCVFRCVKSDVRTEVLSLCLRDRLPT